MKKLEKSMSTTPFMKESARIQSQQIHKVDTYLYHCPHADKSASNKYG